MFSKADTVEMTDSAIWEIIRKEGQRQEDQIELIAKRKLRFACGNGSSGVCFNQ